MRRPSAEIINRLAEALQLSAETLYHKAGLLERPAHDLEAAIAAASELTESQRQALLEVYRSFRTRSERPSTG